VLLLSEVDSGMGRSHNRNVARELAAALGMHYAFAVSYLVLGDDFLENPEGRPNTTALAGAAVLSRWPLGRLVSADLPELRDKFSSRREKRLGKKRALIAELLLPQGPLLCAACHLDSNASPQQRARQLDALLTQADALGVPRVLVGGDWNTTTYDASGPLPLLRDLVHKLVVTGFAATVDGYMTPERRYEQPLFAELARHGYALDGFNDRARGTYWYDVMSPYAVAKLHAKVGRLMTRWLQRRLRPWGGVVPARLDWFAGRGVTPLAAAVVESRDADGRPLSDHAAVSVDLAL
jgi:endonuclease/exonuclease/phosphatase family metal-dependent hydrolase